MKKDDEFMKLVEEKAQDFNEVSVKMGIVKEDGDGGVIACSVETPNGEMPYPVMIKFLVSGIISLLRGHNIEVSPATVLAIFSGVIEELPGLCDDDYRVIKDDDPEDLINMVGDETVH